MWLRNYTLTALLFFGLISNNISAQPMFMGLGELPGGDIGSGASAVSGDGTTAVGWSWSAKGQEAFRWTRSTGMEPLGDLPGGSFHSSGLAVDRAGDAVVGGGAVSAGSEAFLWQRNTGLQGIGDLAGGYLQQSVALDVSGDGSVVAGTGHSDIGYEAFRWTQAGGMQGLGHLKSSDVQSDALGVSDDGSVVVGFSGSFRGYQAFRWTEATGMEGLLPIPDNSNSYAWGVSGDGTTIVGHVNRSYIARPSTNEAFRWTQSGGLQMLGDLPGGDLRSRAMAASYDGSVIVGEAEAAIGQQAFIWDLANGMRSIADVLLSSGIDTTGWNLAGAYGISADGLTVVGAGINPGGKQEAWIATLESAPIPEPKAFVLFALCLAGIIIARNAKPFRQRV